MRTSRCTPSSLPLEPAIGVAALDEQRRRLDAGTLAFRFVHQLDLVAVRFRPARVHALEHAGPILALSAAGTGVDFQIAVVRVRLAGQQRFELAPGDFRFQLAQRIFSVADRLGVVFAFAEFDHHQLIAEFLIDAPKRAELILQRVALPHDALRARRVVPELGILGFFVQLGETPFRSVDVKDASSAARSTA
jgi:hypothetical protein